jgi:hypothetical protein
LQIPSPEKLQAQRRFILFWGAILLLMMAIMASDRFVGRQVLGVRILSTDVPRSCHDGFGRGRFIGPVRSAAPGAGSFGFCGQILTNHGLIALPQSSVFGWEGDREEMFDLLCDGAFARIIVHGHGGDLRPGAPLATHGHKTITRIERITGCS